MTGPEFTAEPELAQKSQYWRGAPELEGARFGGALVLEGAKIGVVASSGAGEPAFGLSQDKPQTGSVSSKNSEVKRSDLLSQFTCLNQASRSRIPLLCM